MGDYRKEKQIKIIDPYSDNFGKFAVLTGFNGLLYSAEITSISNKGYEMRRPVTLERDQFRYVRKSWFCGQ